MKSKHRILVSAENNAYMAWQCQLLHYSCVTRLAHTPLIIVHGSGRVPLSEGFRSIARAGGIVRRAPSYRLTAHGAEYPPRNTAGTLLHAAEMNYFDDEFFVLCDPDMIFVREPDFATVLAADHYPLYLDFGRRDVRAATRRFSVAPEALTKPELYCGVPYVVPVANSMQLAIAWLQAVDMFRSRRWEAIMYAFGLAMIKLGLENKLTHLSCVYETSRDLLTPNAAIIHYCRGDRFWSKRHYWSDMEIPHVWEAAVAASDGTVLGEILSQLRAAKNFYYAQDIW